MMKKFIPLSLVVTLLCHTSHALAQESTTPTLSSNLKMRIPLLHYNDPNASQPTQLWVNLEVVPNADGIILFKVTEFDVIPQSTPKPVKTASKTTTSTRSYPETTNESSEFAGIVEAHNIWRRKIAVPDLKWASELATFAQD